MRRPPDSVHLAAAGEIDGTLLHVGNHVQALAGALGHTGDGVLRHGGGDAGAGGDELVEAVHHAAAAGHHDAIGGHIRHQLRGRALQNRVDALQNLLRGLLEGLQHLRGGDGDGLGQAREQAPALHIHEGLLLPGEDAADGDLHLLRRALAHQDVVLAAHILDHGLVELVARHLDGGGLHHAAQGDDGDVGGAAADVHHHVAVGLGDVDARADGGGYGLLNEVHAAAPGLDARVHHRALLHLGDAGGDADDDPGLEDHEARHLADELLEHPLGHVVIGDHALPEGPDGHDVAGGAAQHLPGLLAHLEQLAGVLVHGHHAGLVEDDPLVFYIYQNGSSPQINPNILRKSAHTFHLVSCLFYS